MRWPGRGAAVPGGERVLTGDMAPITSPEIERVFREEYGRAVAVLIRACGDIELAEDAVQEAFAVAVERWPKTGLPPSPAGWIVTTARNRAIDRLPGSRTGSRTMPISRPASGPFWQSST